nr:MAG TPA: hypothetical protein [Inoviridae sp.]
MQAPTSAAIRREFQAGKPKNCIVRDVQVKIIVTCHGAD